MHSVFLRTFSVLQVLHSPGWVDVTSDKISLQDGEYKFHVLRCEDDGLVFIAGMIDVYCA